MVEVFTALAIILPVLGGAMAWVYNTLDAKHKESIKQVRNEAAERMNILTAGNAKCEDERRALEARVVMLEVSQTADFPRWIRTAEGVLISVSTEFVRLFLAPNKLAARDAVGKRFDEIPGISPVLVQRLHNLDMETLRVGYAHASGVEVANGIAATIIKTVVGNRHTGEILYVACAVPEIALAGHSFSPGSNLMV